MADVDIGAAIREARNSGYQDRDIVEFVGRQDNRVAEALGQGYTPTEVLDFLAPPRSVGEQAGRAVGIAARGALPPTALGTIGATVGAPFGPVGAATGFTIGSLAIPGADALVSAYNAMVGPNEQVELPSSSISRVLDRLGIVKPETRGERMIEAAGGAAGPTAGQIVAGRSLAQLGTPGQRAVGTAISQAPVAQMAAAPTSAATSQAVGELTGSPVAATLAALATATPFGIRPRVRGQTISGEEMNAKIAAQYQKAADSGLQVDITDFRNKTFDIDKKLRSEGWRPENKELSSITDMFSYLVQQSGPQDLEQLKIIRNNIKTAANPQDANQYRLMKVVLNEFDNYLDNIPTNKLLNEKQIPLFEAPTDGLTKSEGLKAWSSARRLFNMEKKAEIFQTMLDNIPIAEKAFSQSGAENYLARELRKIALDEKQMRLFSKDEQAAIRKAAEGGKLQYMLKTIGRVAPVGSIPQLATIGFGLGAGWDVAGTIAGAGLASRLAAEQMRVGDVQRIVDMLRTGQRQPSILQAVPTTAARGLLSTQTE